MEVEEAMEIALGTLDSEISRLNGLPKPTKYQVDKLLEAMAAYDVLANYHALMV